MDGNSADINSQPRKNTETPIHSGRPTDALPPENPVSSDPGILPDDCRPKRDAEYWARRKTMVAQYSEEAFCQQTTLECNLALINGDLMSHLGSIHEQLERAAEQTTDPLDKLRLVSTLSPEINKTSREIRELSGMLTRAEHQRYQDELAWSRSDKRQAK